jgi:ATP-dependent helicase HrpB
MQEFYGINTHPSVLNSSLDLNLALLSPAKRPLQITQDLPGFFKGNYKEVQKEMKGRYPKHFWPDDPLTAKATASTKKYM